MSCLRADGGRFLKAGKLGSIAVKGVQSRLMSVFIRHGRVWGDHGLPHVALICVEGKVDYS